MKIKALLLAIGVYLVIMIGYMLLKGLIDFSNVTASLTDGMGITAENFLYVSLYISLMNSFFKFCSPFENKLIIFNNDS